MSPKWEVTLLHNPGKWTGPSMTFLSRTPSPKISEYKTGN